MSKTNDKIKKENNELAEQGAELTREAFYTKPAVIAMAAVLAVVLIVGIFLVMMMNSIGITVGQFLTDEYARGDFFAFLFKTSAAPVDFINGNLSGFITVSEEQYKDYEIKINVPPVSDAELEEDIIKLLASNRGERDGDYRFDLDDEIRPGDVVYLRYAGYLIDEDGNRVEIPGETNFKLSDTELKATGGIKIGGGSMMSGFEGSLVGIVPSEHQCEFTLAKGGSVLEGDVVYVTATYVKESDGMLYEGENIRIDLGDENVEDMWGAGIYNYLAEKSIGITNTTPITMSCNGTDVNGNPINEKITFVKAKVNYATRNCENDKVLTVKAAYPYDYEDKELRGETVYYDVFFLGVTSYESPELTDTFILDTLKLTEEKLSDYEGETLVERFRSYRLSLLEAKRNERVKQDSEDAMWEYLKSSIAIKKLPKREYLRVYENYYYTVRSGYIAATEEGLGYESIDEYARDFYGLTTEDDWLLLIEEKSISDVTEKLIFYSIIRAEGLIPTDEEYRAIYRRELELDYKYYSGKTKDDFSSAEAYEKALADYEEEMLENVGESYYKDAVYYAYATGKILDFATVKNEAVK